jgi:hypothetical protein
MIDEHPDPDIELPPMDEQWILDIFLDNKLGALDGILWRSSLLRLWRLFAKTVLLDNLLALLDRVHNVDSLASVQPHGLEDP